MGVYGVPRCVVSLRWGQIDSVRGPPDLMVPLPPPTQSLLPSLSFPPPAFSRLVSVSKINVHFASCALCSWTNPLSRKADGDGGRNKRFILFSSFLRKNHCSLSVSQSFVSTDFSALPMNARGYLSVLFFFFTYLNEKGLRLKNHKLRTDIWRCCLRVWKSISMHVGVDERGVPDSFFSRRTLHLARASTCSKCRSKIFHPLLRSTLLWKRITTSYIDLAVFGEVSVTSTAIKYQSLSIIVSLPQNENFIYCKYYQLVKNGKLYENGVFWPIPSVLSQVREVKRGLGEPLGYSD